jgi:hypothetical protein
VVLGPTLAQPDAPEAMDVDQEKFPIQGVELSFPAKPLSVDDYACLGRGIEAVIQKSGGYAKKYLVAALSEHVPENILGSVLPSLTTQKSRTNYLRRCAEAIPPNENILYTLHYPPHSTRQRLILPDQREALENFFLEQCKPETDPDGTQLARTVSESELFRTFKLQDSSGGVGKATFMRVMTENHIHKARHSEFDLFYCPHCHNMANIQLEKPSPDAPDATKRQYIDYLDYKAHRLRVQRQWELYHSILNQLDESTVLVLQDFTKDFTQKHKAVILCFVIFRKKGGNVIWNCIDFCGKEGSERSNVYFIHAGWASLIQLGVFRDIHLIHVFSDSGANEFYNSSVLYLLSSLQNSTMKILPHFFEGCHGKSMADAHFGTCKRRGHNLLHFLDPKLQYTHLYWASVHDSLKHGQCFLLPVNSGKWMASTIQGISECHNFELIEQGKIIMIKDLDGSRVHADIQLKTRKPKPSEAPTSPTNKRKAEKDHCRVKKKPQIEAKPKIEARPKKPKISVRELKDLQNPKHLEGLHGPKRK